jgi:hypothetical protein
MKAYIYHVETNQIAVVIEGESNAAIEAEAERQNYDQDVFGLTYSDVGLVEMYDTEFVAA